MPNPKITFDHCFNQQQDNFLAMAGTESMELTHVPDTRIFHSRDAGISPDLCSVREVTGLRRGQPFDNSTFLCEC